VVVEKRGGFCSILFNFALIEAETRHLGLFCKFRAVKHKTHEFGDNHPMLAENINPV
jgi:hypothetical protein